MYCVLLDRQLTDLYSPTMRPAVDSLRPMHSHEARIKWKRVVALRHLSYRKRL